MNPSQGMPAETGVIYPLRSWSRSRSRAILSTIARFHAQSSLRLSLNNAKSST